MDDGWMDGWMLMDGCHAQRAVAYSTDTIASYCSPPTVLTRRLVLFCTVEEVRWHRYRRTGQR